MKHRYKFVSNSSSSSFVIAGVELADTKHNRIILAKMSMNEFDQNDEDSIRDALDSFGNNTEDDCVILVGEDGEASKGKIILGIPLAWGDKLENKRYDIEKLRKDAWMLIEKFNVYAKGEDFQTPSKLRIFTGTRYS
jgi:hypothetical protein